MGVRSRLSDWWRRAGQEMPERVPAPVDLWEAIGVFAGARISAQELERDKKRHPFPAARLSEARAHPDDWLYEFVGDRDLAKDAPPTAIKGAWKIGADGVPTGHYLENPNFGRRA